MDTKLIFKALYNIVMDSESGCMLDTLSVKIDAPKFDSGLDVFIQHVLFCVDRVCTPSEISFMHRFEEEYKRLTKEQNEISQSRD